LKLTLVATLAGHGVSRLRALYTQPLTLLLAIPAPCCSSRASTSRS
jgi:hypothetical protein